MCEQLLFNFKTDISSIGIPSKLNNPFSTTIPEIAKIAAKEFQEFIGLESEKWNYNFSTQRGKMFGILVLQKQDHTYCYIGTVSGKLPENAKCNKFIPSVFDESTDDFFINKGMIGLSEISNQIKKANHPSEIILLKENKNQLPFKNSFLIIIIFLIFQEKRRIYWKFSRIQLMETLHLLLVNVLPLNYYNMLLNII